MAYTFGANDVANATGVLSTATASLSGVNSTLAMFLLAIFAAAGIALGAFMFGSRVIETAGRRITRLNYVMGAAAVWSGVLTIYIFMTVPFIIWGWGLPLSTTHAIIGAIIGVGLTRGSSGIDRKIVKRIVASWFITFPAAALLSIFLYVVLSQFIVI